MVATNCGQHKREVSLRIVFISLCGTEDRYVLREIRKIHANVTVVQPFFRGLRPDTVSRPKTYLRSFTDWFEARWADLRGGLGRYFVRQILFEGESPGPVPDILKWEINSSDSIEKIHELDPDVILTCTAPMLKREIFSEARIAAFNIHFGILPAYRGNHTIFWPLVKGDFDRVGISIHHLSDRLDQGDLVARIYPPLSERDHEFSILANATRLAAAVVLEILAKANDGQAISSKPQESGGILYLNRDRTAIADGVYAIRWILGMNRPAPREGRVERFY